MFDWENAIALHAMQANQSSSHGEGEVSWVFSSCGRHVGYILELQRGCPFETLVYSLKSGSCLGMRDNSRCKLGVAGKYRHFWKLSVSSGLFFYLTQ